MDWFTFYLSGIIIALFCVWLLALTIEIHSCVYQFLPFYFWVVFHCINVYPFTCQWPLAFFPIFGYCEYSCYGHLHSRLCMDINFCFPWVNNLDMEWLGIYLTFKETTLQFSKALCLITFLPAGHESYSIYTSPTFGAGSFWIFTPSGRCGVYALWCASPWGLLWSMLPYVYWPFIPLIWWSSQSPLPIWKINLSVFFFSFNYKNPLFWIQSPLSLIAIL